ncbi:MAG: hypothetical protein ABI369_03165, partial [Acetobacteraceae bacterium]
MKLTTCCFTSNGRCSITASRNRSAPYGVAPCSIQARRLHLRHQCDTLPGGADDPVGAQSLPAAEAVTDRRVDATGVEIDQGSACGQAQIDRRVFRMERAEARHQPGRSEGRRSAQGQGSRAGNRGQPLRRLADLAKGVAHRRQVGPAS